MNAREIIAKWILGYADREARAGNILADLSAAGYRLVAPGELDAETLKRAAKAQCSGCATGVPINDEGYHQQGSFTFPCHASAIRALTPSSMEGKE